MGRMLLAAGPSTVRATATGMPPLTRAAMVVATAETAGAMAVENNGLAAFSLPSSLAILS